MSGHSMRRQIGKSGIGMRFDRQKWMILACGLLAITVLTFLDYWTTWEFSLALGYVIVIWIMSFNLGVYVGTFFALVGALCWTTSELLSDMPYTYWFAPYWNAAIRFVIFAILAYLSTFPKRIHLVEEIARIDFLTGVANGRQFFEKAGIEMERANRYKSAFTLIYLDLDGFKAVNDLLGHNAGDNVLKKVAQTIQANLRATDCVARLGGDEFAVLLSQADYDSADRYLEKMTGQLSQTMRENGWNVTFSIGAMTYINLPSSIDDMIRRADDLMYSVKRDGKNKIKHEVFCGGSSSRR
jgi:diguanylate cyclase (GGDEF)-like protein